MNHGSPQLRLLKKYRKSPAGAQAKNDSNKTGYGYRTDFQPF